MELNILRRVEIEIGGEKLAHYFADLRGDEWLDHQRALAEMTGDGAAENLRRVLDVYDARCKKVEGYTFNGVDIMSLSYPLYPGEGEGEGIRRWTDLIPGDHKFAAWTELVTGANAKKNS